MTDHRPLLYEGKAKKLFAADDPAQVIHYFKDDATAFNARKRGSILDKGVVNAAMSASLFQLLERYGVETHFIAALSDRELLTRRVSIIPLEVVVRNRAAGSLAKRLGLQRGLPIDPPIVELYYKNDELGDPLVLDDHVRLLGAVDPGMVPHLKHRALRINDILKPFFEKRRLTLVDFKLEFGLEDGRLIVADEISPDTCRLWDHETGDSLDKDRFRHDLGRVEESYQDVLRRIRETDVSHGRVMNDGQSKRMKAKVYVTLKPGILDPQGKAILEALGHLGYEAVQDVRTGKYLEVDLGDQERGGAETQLRAMCEKLLANPVIEEYRFEIMEGN